MDPRPIVFDARWIGDHGIGRFAREVRRSWGGAADLESGGSPSDPLDPARLALRLRDGKHFFYSPGYNAPIGSRTPFAITIHDLSHIDFAPNRTLAKSIYYDHVLRPACHRASLLVTVSEFTRQRIADWSGVAIDKIVNVGCGVDALFRPEGARLDLGHPYLLCMGNRRPNKNEVRTLDAFAQVARRDDTLHLMYSGSRSAELTAAIADRNLAHRVHFLGAVADAELAAAYRGARAVLFASLHEGFGLPVVEAQACGTPVITSRVCALPEVAGDAALLVDPHSISDIAAAIDRLLCDPARAAHLAERGIVNAARYSWEATRARVHTVIGAAAHR